MATDTIAMYTERRSHERKAVLRLSACYVRIAKTEVRTILLSFAQWSRASDASLLKRRGPKNGRSPKTMRS